MITCKTFERKKYHAIIFREILTGVAEVWGELEPHSASSLEVKEAPGTEWVDSKPA